MLSSLPSVTESDSYQRTLVFRCLTWWTVLHQKVKTEVPLTKGPTEATPLGTVKTQHGEGSRGVQGYRLQCDLTEQG